MHKVVRNAPPMSLVLKHQEWTALLRVNQDINEDWEILEKNIKDDIRVALREMYKGCCCYCEGKVELVSYLHIEHFKPKSKYKKLCYAYNNLHYCCEKCNITKGTQYSTKMFSPTTCDPEIFIKYNGEIAVGQDLEGRGTYMIRVLRLNDRKELKDERAKILREFEKRQKVINGSIEKIVKNHYNERDIELLLPHINLLISDIQTHMQHGESYCSMLKHNFNDYLETLKKVSETLEDKYVNS